MATFEFVVQIIITASATIVAVATVGIYRRMDNLVSRVEKHDRTLYGESDIDGWDGLVARVASHESELEDTREDEQYER
jgi:hypothetical protein